MDDFWKGILIYPIINYFFLFNFELNIKIQQGTAYF